MLWLLFVFVALLAQPANAQTTRTCNTDSQAFVSRNAFGAHPVCQPNLFYCPITPDDDAGTGVFAFLRGNNGNFYCQSVTKIETLYTSLAPILPTHKYIWQAPFDVITAVVYGPREYGSQEVYFRHPLVCDGLGWALGTIQEQAIAGSTKLSATIIPYVLAPNNFFKTNWFCQGDRKYYLSVEQMQYAVPLIQPGLTVSVLPELTAARPVCSLDCEFKPNQQCSQGRVRKCECKPPTIPVATEVNGLTGCLTSVLWDTILPEKAYSVNEPGDIRIVNVYDCISPRGSPEWQWCRNTVKQNMGVSDVCNYHGRALMAPGFAAERFIYPNYDCWCDQGWGGQRCNFRCFRDSPEDVCRPENNCEKLRMFNSFDVSGNCVPFDPRTRLVDIRLFENLLNTNNVLFIGFPKTPSGSQLTTGSFTGTKCFVNTHQPEVFTVFVHNANRGYSFPQYKILCNQPAVVNNVATVTWFVVTTTALVVTGNSYSCEHSINPATGRPATDAEVRANPSLQSFRNRTIPIPGSSAPLNPCVWGNDPVQNPLYSGGNGANDEISFPLNFIRDSYGGLDHNYVFTAPSTSTFETLFAPQCNNVNTYVTDVKVPLANQPGVFFVQQVCAPCPADCQSGEYCDRSPLCVAGSFCGLPGVCRCKRNHVREDGFVGCLPLVCRPGTAGRRCEIVCPACPSTELICNAGPFGDGTCICPDRNQHYNTQLRMCVDQSCSTFPTLCNGNGECIRSKNYEFCMCDRGFTGNKCEIPRVEAELNPSQVAALPIPTFQQYESKFSECDCFVRWLLPRTVSRTIPVPRGYQLVADYSVPLAPMRTPLLGASGITIVGNADQAKFMCYHDSECAGFVLFRDSLYWAKTLQTDPGLDVYTVYFLQNTRVPNPSAVTIPSGVNALLYEVDRFSLYNCEKFVLDVAFYKNKYRAETDAFCRAEVAAINAAAPPGSILLTTAVVCFTDPMVRKHWRYHGHLLRFQPNNKCMLTPSLYDPKSYCSASRCASGEGLPCSANGYCVDAPDNKFQCDCKRFNLPGDSGILGLNNRIAWIGNSCQFSVASTCVNRGSTSLCSGNSASCKPRLAFSGDFFLGQFESQRVEDYVPFCDCDGTSFEGTFCEQSKCGPKSQGCKGVSASGGDCVRQGDNSYKCVCQRGAIGEFCEIDASACLFDDLKCSSAGICRPPDRFNSKPYCDCQEGFSGEFCQDSLCPPDVMVPGRGICLNRALQRCFAPFSGSRCQNNDCGRYNGTVVVDSDNIPVGCSCYKPNFDNTRNNVAVATCWPQCPVLDGSLCGAFHQRPHVCAQTQTFDGVRAAECQCAQGYIQVPHPTTANVLVCEKYCRNGEVPVDWNQLTPSPCECSDASGFDTFNNRPRCDNPICANQGTFLVTTQQCDCLRPWTSFDRCKSHSCGSRGAPVAWLNVTEATSPFKCECRAPYAPQFRQNPFDCSGTVCGVNGQLNPFYTAALSTNLWCTCSGKYKSDCTNPAGCQYCSITTCLNNGFSSPAAKSLCICPFPYVNGPKGICESTICELETTASFSSGLCNCKPGFLGQRCETALCRNGGRFDIDSGVCLCSSGFFGTKCDVFYLDVLDYIRNFTTLFPPPVVVPVERNPEPNATIPDSSSATKLGFVVSMLVVVLHAFHSAKNVF